MRTFDEIFELAAERHGGAEALEGMLAEQKPKSEAELAAIPDDRWLSMFSKCVFQAGFNWKVIEQKWPGMEEAFGGFDTARCAMLSDDDVDALLNDTRIVRNAQKVMAVRGNAFLLRQLAAEHGSAAAVFASWPVSDTIGLLEMLKTRGARLGGNTAQMALRFMGRDTFILSKSVIAALNREEVIGAAVFSKRAMQAVQTAFNEWMKQSGRSMSEISRTLAFSVDE
ncbi:3-methyladenine DNA glycosylase [Breoghania sp. L-A4]|nr:3-methyladenine DNA glycosylase [Breoghania sp. L-A4]